MRISDWSSDVCSSDLHDAAAAWIIRRENSDWSEQDQAAFDGWLAESDGNRAAYWRLKHSWNEADRIGSLGMRADDIPAVRRVTQYWKPALAAASLALMVGIGAVQYSLKSPVSESALATMRYDTPRSEEHTS